MVWFVFACLQRYESRCTKPGTVGKLFLSESDDDPKRGDATAKWNIGQLIKAGKTKDAPHCGYAFQRIKLLVAMTADRRATPKLLQQTVDRLLCNAEMACNFR